MRSASTDGNSKKMVMTGRILTSLAVLFMLMDGVMKLFKPAFVVEASSQMGYPEAMLPGIGVALIICTAIYIIPRTSIFGAILLTGYLGGAVASQVRIAAGWFEVAFPVLFAALIWSGLWLRDQRLQSLLTLSGEAGENRHAGFVATH